MNPSLENLIRSFDGNRVPEEVYEATCGLIDSLAGGEASAVFRHYVETNDEGSSYFLPLNMAEGCLSDMRRAANPRT